MAAVRMALPPGNVNNSYVRGTDHQRPSRNAQRHSRGASVPFAQRRSYTKPTLDLNQDWKTYEEVRVRIIALHGSLSPEISISDIYDHLVSYGTLTRIEILNNYGGLWPRAAMVTFSPPPETALWSHPNIGNIQRNGYSSGLLRADLRTSPDYQNDSIVSCPFDSLDFGFVHEENHFVIMRSVYAQNFQDIKLQVNKQRRHMTVFFSVDEDYLHSCQSGYCSSPVNEPKSYPSVIRHDFKFEISFKLLQHVLRRQIDDETTELIISLPTTSAPLFSKKMDPRSTIDPNTTLWNIHNAWFRRTNLYSNEMGKDVQEQSLSIQEAEPFVDIGNWTTYRLCFRNDMVNSPQFIELSKTLDKHNIGMLPSTFNVCYIDNVPDARASSFWESFGPRLDAQTDTLSIMRGLADRDVVQLDWPVRYQLEVCISKKLLHPSNLSQQFASALSKLGQKSALKLLEAIADRNVRYFEPMDIFNLRRNSLKSTKRVPNNHVLQRLVIVRPSGLEMNTPAVDESNRILRSYPQHAEHFLRVSFRDEKSQGKLFPTDDERNDALYNRVHRCLNKGIIIGNRHFEWLASGNSQFREHGAYFFNSVSLMTAHSIRAEMGNFSVDKEVAKAASRMGQCFSTTREFDGSIEIQDIDDVTNIDPNDGRKYTFTDGVGMISRLLATLVNRQMRFPKDNTTFQFRLGGSKGVLSVADIGKGQVVKTRPSQNKFTAERKRLEIIKPAVFVQAELNRQLIIILSCLGIYDHVFMEKVQAQLGDLNEAMSNSTKAVTLLRQSVDVNSMTVAIADMIEDGFMERKEPFVHTLLGLWRAWYHKILKEKARIKVTQGAFVIGVTDETKSLSGHYHHRQPRRRDRASREQWIASLPEIFLQISELEDRSQFRIIEGVCILARNPSLHPGDMRVVRAVNNPKLHHHKNVVVFPQTGDRDIPSMCSGGDLDGDDYFISWDEQLIPRLHEWNHDPLDHGCARPKKVDVVTEGQVKDFFVQHMKHDALGRIAHAWLAQADQSNEGPKNETCKKLAALHSTAVDFPKSGNPAEQGLLKRLRPRKYPHYLQHNRPDHQCYHSEKIIGQLYDEVQTIDFKPILGQAFDNRVRDLYEKDDERDKVIREIKVEYDAALRRIMAQFEIETECELWTAFLLTHSNSVKEYELQTKVGTLVTSVKEKFRNSCIKKAGGMSSGKLWPFVAAMYEITAQDVAHSISDLQKTYGFDENTVPDMEPHERPFFSFPWLFAHQLGRIAECTALPRAEDERVENSVSHDLEQSPIEHSVTHDENINGNAQQLNVATPCAESATLNGKDDCSNPTNPHMGHTKHFASKTPLSADLVDINIDVDCALNADDHHNPFVDVNGESNSTFEPHIGDMNGIVERGDSIDLNEKANGSSIHSEASSITQELKGFSQHLEHEVAQPLGSGKFDIVKVHSDVDKGHSANKSIVNSKPIHSGLSQPAKPVEFPTVDSQSSGENYVEDEEEEEEDSADGPHKAFRRLADLAGNDSE